MLKIKITGMVKEVAVMSMIREERRVCKWKGYNDDNNNDDDDDDDDDGEDEDEKVI